ncbi:daptide-type RiPP [Actinomyces sp. 2119]
MSVYTQITELESLDTPNDWVDFGAGVATGAAAGCLVVGGVVVLT